MIRKIRTKKHKGAIFLKDTKTDTFIAKVYAGAFAERIANDFIESYTRKAVKELC